MTATSISARAAKRVRRKDVRRNANGTYAAELESLPQNWRAEFLAALAETSNVSRACEHAGVSPGTVYDLRRRDTGFASRWMDALCEGYDNLEMEMLFFLRNGESTEPGAKRFNFPVALRMLLAHRENVIREKARRRHVTVEEVRTSIDRKVAEMRERVLAARTAASAAEDNSQAASDDES
ncbi:MAG: hypothetical protein ABIM50_07395 [Novosphingobium sp.]